MAIIKLIVTGNMEKHALVPSLQKVFPTERTNNRGAVEQVTWAPARQLPAATSHRLLPLTENQTPNTLMGGLVQAMLDEVLIGKTGTPADLVIVIDDVELGNIGQESLIAQHFRAAVQRKLDAFPTMAVRERHRVTIKEKCSFHLLKPMVESYLFSDAAAIVAAGVARNTTPLLCHPSDVEQFESSDQNWLPTCFRENQSRQIKMPWWRHEKHPKHYLQHLTERNSVTYIETKQGSEALKLLDWKAVAKVSSDAAIVRAMLEDIADWFGVVNPLNERGNPDTVFYRTTTVPAQERILRNM